MIDDIWNWSLNKYSQNLLGGLYFLRLEVGEERKKWRDRTPDLYELSQSTRWLQEIEEEKKTLGLQYVIYVPNMKTMPQRTLK